MFYLQFNRQNRWPWTQLRRLHVTLFVAFQQTVSALVALFAGTSRYRTSADLANQATGQMLRHERVIRKHVEFAALLAPPRFIGDGVGHQVMSAKGQFELIPVVNYHLKFGSPLHTIFNHLQHQTRRLVQECLCTGAGQTGEGRRFR